MRRRAEAGFALPWAMMLALAASGLAFVVLERDRTLRRDLVTDDRAFASRHAAEGALESLRHRLRDTPDLRSARFAIGGCDVDCAVEPYGDAAWTVRVVARPGGARITARLGATADLPALVSVEANR